MEAENTEVAMKAAVVMETVVATKTAKTIRMRKEEKAKRAIAAEVVATIVVMAVENIVAAVVETIVAVIEVAMVITVVVTEEAIQVIILQVTTKFPDQTTMTGTIAVVTRRR